MYLTIRQLASSKYLICRCENCGKFFIPYSNHDTKYCDNIFKGNKTCKDLAPEIVYKQKLEKRPFIKKYRTRYQTLQKSASINPKLTKKDMKILKKFVLLKRTII